MDREIEREGFVDQLIDGFSIFWWIVAGLSFAIIVRLVGLLLVLGLMTIAALFLALVLPLPWFLTPLGT